MAHLKQVGKRVVTTNSIDRATGEVLETTQQVSITNIVMGDKDNFSLVFGSIGEVLSAVSFTDLKVILWCSQNCTINKNSVTLDKPTRKKICAKYGLMDQTIKNSICSLTRNEFLIREDRATYRINPAYFWRGELGERKTALRLVLEAEQLKEKKSAIDKQAWDSEAFTNGTNG